VKRIILACLVGSIWLFGQAHSQQQDCCECSSAAANFGVAVPAGFGAAQCPIACSSNGGASTGFHPGACVTYHYHPYPPAPIPNYCPIKTIGGDCKGNNWCQCNSEKIFFDKTTVKVDDFVTLTVYLGDLGSGKPPTEKYGTAYIDWGDGTVDRNLAYGNGIFRHQYRTKGTFTVTMTQGRAFKWDAHDGSCSFVCSADESHTVVVEPTGG
jgi:hypothetical protein